MFSNSPHRSSNSLLPHPVPLRPTSNYYSDIHTQFQSFAFVELTQIQNQTNEWIIRGKDIQIA